MKKTSQLGIAALALATIVSPIVWTGHASAKADTVTASADSAASSAAAASAAVSSATTELSGAAGTGTADGTFATWSGNPVPITDVWSDNNADSLNFWPLQKGGALANWNKPIDVAVGALDSGETWQAAASGAYDTRWAASLTKLKSLRSNTTATTYIRFAHEMNGNWYPWSVTASNYTYFDAAWKRYRALQKQIFPASKLVFNLNRESAASSGIAWTKYFPGSQYVDVLSVDYYNQYPYVATQAAWQSSLSQTDAFGAPKGLDTYLAYAQTQGLPLAVSEWSGKASFGDSPLFVSNMLAYFKSHAGNSVGHIAYDNLFNVGGYNGDYQLFGSSTKLPLSAAAYKAFFAAAAKPAAAPPPVSTPTPTPPSAVADTLHAGDTMLPGDSLTSQNGKYHFEFQADGNLVVYTAAGKAIWSSKTFKKPATVLRMQDDANFVLYPRTGKALWNTVTWGKGAGASVTVENDGDLVVSNAAGTALWSSAR
ncbi:glycosyl hydrolase [Frondihabitans cladoniiphilus]|uniref:Glycosyl hydrolase family 26 n=1 Tax=Frondihabitans cladoniiphilus TaxID=715785 RepID=A0ABP8VXU2_9MICO